jgi:uncharacterized phiE125 gp8 family phage protein
MDSPPFPVAAIAAARDAVRGELRIDGHGEDATIERMTAGALALCEAFTGQVLIVREWQVSLPVEGGWQLLGPVPVVSIDGVEDADGVALAADAYAIDIDAGRRGWVRAMAAGSLRRVRVRLTAGLAAGWSDLPAPIAQGIVKMAAHLIEAREGAAPPAAVAALWRPWRRMRLSAERRA